MLFPEITSLDVCDQREKKNDTISDLEVKLPFQEPNFILRSDGELKFRISPNHFTKPILLKHTNYTK